jgi:TolB-like protein/tetratricopeptide (TPR) repeat protein
MRQLASIMFTDMAGFTALMQQNEQAAMAKRRRLKEVLEASVPAYHGRIIEYAGDGALSIFNSAIESVQCAIAIQQALFREPKVALRIGIHSGDISIEEGIIYGDGVNLASRIESLSVPGAVLVSEKVFDEMSNQSGLDAVEIGLFEFKHVHKPVRVFAIRAESLVIPSRNELNGKTKPAVNRLAILPFMNLSHDPENEYFSDGITEELLNAICKVEGLQVTARTSSFAFKGMNKDIREIGAQLNVDRVLEGSVRKAGNKVRITAQLINAADGYHIWSETYDRDLTDIFEVQDEISHIIANKFRQNLAEAVHRETLLHAPTHTIEAYTLYLKGLHFFNQVSPGEVQKGIACFEKAIALEPGYANAYGMMASCYAILGASGQMQAEKAFVKVHAYADIALQLDPSIASGYTAKGSAYLLYDWKWKEAYAALDKAIALHPATTTAHQMLSFYYMITSQPEEAVRIMELAYELDPLSPLVNKFLADAYLFAGRTDESLRQCEIMLDIYPKMGVAMEVQGWSVGVRGDWKRAAEIFEEARKLNNQTGLKGLFSVGCAYANAGETAKALDCIDKIEQLQAQEPGKVLDTDLALIWLSLGNADKAFHHLFQCVEKKIGPVAIIINHPMFKVPVHDPRFRLLKAKLNLE